MNVYSLSRMASLLFETCPMTPQNLFNRFLSNCRSYNPSYTPTVEMLLEIISKMNEVGMTKESTGKFDINEDLINKVNRKAGYRAIRLETVNRRTLLVIRTRHSINHKIVINSASDVIRKMIAISDTHFCKNSVREFKFENPEDSKQIRDQLRKWGYAPYTPLYEGSKYMTLSF